MIFFCRESNCLASPPPMCFVLCAFLQVSLGGLLSLPVCVHSTSGAQRCSGAASCSLLLQITSPAPSFPPQELLGYLKLKGKIRALVEGIIGKGSNIFKPPRNYSIQYRAALGAGVECKYICTLNRSGVFPGYSLYKCCNFLL